MRRPKPKARSIHIPTLWRTALTTALRAEYHGRRFDDATSCPACGATTWHRVGWTSRLFALLIVDDDTDNDDVEKDSSEATATQQSAVVVVDTTATTEKNTEFTASPPTAPRHTTMTTTTTTHAFEPIRVFLQRYRCRQCGAYFTATGPFYPRIMYGAPIVDLALYLASANPFNRVERILMSLGVQVDRHTVQNWVRLYGDRVKHRAGISLAGSVLGINIVKLLFGVENVAQLRRAHPELAPILTGVADETYPAKKGAKKALREDNARRKAQGKKPRRFPESFMVATSYVPQVETYAAIQVTDVPFTSLHAAVVLKPLAGGRGECEA